MKIKTRKILVTTAIIIAGIYLLAVLLIPPVALNLLSNKHVNYSRVFSSEEAGLPAADTLWLQSADGLRIHALELRPESSPTAAIICLTGIENPSVTYFLGHARLFHEMGMLTILPEVRGHGKSDGERVCLAYEESADVKAASDYILSNYGDIPIVVAGLSMGGAIAIRSIGKNPDIDALISISAFSSTQDVISGYIGRYISRPLAWPTKFTTAVSASLKFKVNAFRETPLRAIAGLDGRPALLMHSRKDSEVPFRCFEKLSKEASKATDRLQTYVVDGDEHFVCSSFGVPENDSSYFHTLKSFLETIVTQP